MSGANLNELLTRVTGMNRIDVLVSQQSWEDNAGSLNIVRRRLETAAPKVRKGFGEDSEIGIQAEAAFTRAAKRIGDRREQLVAAATALGGVLTAMREAESAADDAPDEPGDKPKPPTGLGDDTPEDITKLKVYANKVTGYNRSVTAYGDADAEARKKIEEIVRTYTEASTVFAGIHGDTGEGPTGGYPPGPGPGGPGVPPPTGTVPIGRPPTSLPPNLPPNQPPTLPPGGPIDPGFPYPVPEGPGLVPGPIDGPSVGPGGPGGGIGGNPAVLGGLASAGVLGGPGLVKGIRGLLGGRGFGATPGAIGASSRVGGPASLGRGGAGVPGSQVNRAGGRGAGGGRGAIGSQGGRGGKGGRSGGRGAAAAAGGRGRGKDERKDGRDRDLFDDGQDWLDDEGAAPGVLD